MSRQDFETLVDPASVIDLNDFNDYRLSSAGELEVSRYFNHPIYAEVGSALLSLTKIELPHEPGDTAMGIPHTAYILKNEDASSGNASMLIDDAQQVHPVEWEKFVAVYTRGKLMIGTAEDATPGLELPSTVAPYHLQLRLGNMNGNVHFAGFSGSENTKIHLHPEDAHMVGHPRRWFSWQMGQIVTREFVEQRWTR